MKKNKRGQAMVEYIIIVVLVAIAALAIFGAFSDTIRMKLSGAVAEMDNGAGVQQAQQAVQNSSQSVLKNLDADGLNN